MSGPTWYPAILERLKELWPTGESAAKCAAILNAEFGTTFTRNAVIGQVHRHIRPRKIHAHPKARDNSSHRKPRPVIKREPTMILLDPVPMLTRPDNRCPFPLWPHDAPTGGPDYTVCGAHRAAGESYCAGHMKLTHTTPKTRITAEDRAKAAEAARVTGMERMFG